jgi:hypothetical protein
MTPKTTLNSPWLIRMALLIVLFLGFGIYGAYDGFVAYPAQNHHWQVYHEYLAAHEGSAEGWPEYAAEQGVPATPPEEGPPNEAGEPTPPRAPFDFITQYIFVVIGLAVGLTGLVWLVISSRRWFAADDEALIVSGQRIPFDKITDIDKSRWDRKGIAVVTYQQNGGTATVTLDDWKYKGTAPILERIERHRGGSEPQSAEEASETSA